MIPKHEEFQSIITIIIDIYKLATASADIPSARGCGLSDSIYEDFSPRSLHRDHVCGAARRVRGDGASAPGDAKISAGSILLPVVLVLVFTRPPFKRRALRNIF